MEPQNKTKQGSKHTLIMVLCCLVPMLFVVLFLKTGTGGALSFLVILLCPLMHFFLMRGMHGKHNHHEPSDHSVMHTETNAKREPQLLDMNSSTEESPLLSRLASGQPAPAEAVEADQFPSGRQTSIAAGVVNESQQEERRDKTS